MWGSQGESWQRVKPLPTRLPVLHPDSYFPQEGFASSEKLIQVSSPTSLQCCFNASFGRWQKIGIERGIFPPSPCTSLPTTGGHLRSLVVY
jgi:hypothetical protein